MQKKLKIYTLIVAVLFTAILVLLYFLDTSLDWGKLKIVSCILLSIWVFFIPPTILYYAYKLHNSDMEYSIRFGIAVGANGFLGILLAPFFGLLAYFKGLDKVKFTGKFFER